MRTIFIGDVHGCSRELRELVDKLELTPQDRLIFLGDLINKGPDSLGVLKIVESIKAECLMGNHELGFIKLFEGHNIPAASGFERVRQQLGNEAQKWADWMKLLPPFIEEDNFIAVHAGLVPGRSLKKTSIKLLTRIRTWDGTGDNLNNLSNPPWYDFYEGHKPVIYGHWAAKGLNLRHNTIGLDSGCVWGGSLTAYVLETNQVIEVKANHAYIPPDWE